jgi:predicted anti-sigma-YlaC factor YlaD
MSAVELSCREVVEILDDYLAGAMAATERARVERHLAECEGCLNYLEQLRTTIRLTGRLTEQAVPPEAMAALLGAFRTWRGDGHPQSSGNRESALGRDAGQGEELGA